MEVEQIAYWRGQRLEDLSREELIEALRYCGTELLRMQEQRVNMSREEHLRELYLGLGKAQGNYPPPTRKTWLERLFGC